MFLTVRKWKMKKKEDLNLDLPEKEFFIVKTYN